MLNTGGNNKVNEKSIELRRRLFPNNTVRG